MRKLSRYLLALSVFTSGCAVQQVDNAPTLPKAQVTQDGGNYRISRGPVSVLVMPDVGGRIASVRYQQQELLITPEQREDLLWGSVLWTGPQQDWGWPPPPVLDSQPYQVRVGEGELTVVSGVDPDLGIQFSKRYSFHSTRAEFVIDYEIRNHSREAKTLAPWEVTRVPPSGHVFFPLGKNEIVDGGMNSLPVARRGAYVWYEYDPAILQGDHKLMTDGAEGWLAYANGNLLFTKYFPDVTPAQNVPGEGEIHIYTDPRKSYIELEQQGPLQQLAPGEALQWQVRWSIEPWSPVLVGDEAAALD